MMLLVTLRKAIEGFLTETVINFGCLIRYIFVTESELLKKKSKFLQ